ncbi:DUF5655 domain-containing protein [Specibacter cremeus]|uniref:DUF5655 domain-containing protein n=1 Tax=Specibacter cremeus TaxID=1629051 RepID=UPI000F78B3E9|nr:DUF5655 domain-containing protein [Specibacter cremeus]
MAGDNFKSWRGMLDENIGLLLRRTGHGVPWWVARARAEAPKAQAPDGEPATRAWLAGQGVTGYAQNPVMWELFGYPDFLLTDAAELLDGQYADRPRLRPIADAVIELALGVGDVDVQVRKTFVSLHTPRRKFAQVTPATKSAVDVLLRTAAPVAGRLEEVRNPDTLTRRIRLTTAQAVDDVVRDALARAYRENL